MPLPPSRSFTDRVVAGTTCSTVADAGADARDGDDADKRGDARAKASERSTASRRAMASACAVVKHQKTQHKIDTALCVLDRVCPQRAAHQRRQTASPSSGWLQRPWSATLRSERYCSSRSCRNQRQGPHLSISGLPATQGIPLSYDLRKMVTLTQVI